MKDDGAQRLLQRLVRRIPAQKLEETVGEWSSLTEAQRSSVDYSQAKWSITESLLDLCRENRLTAKHIANLEMIYVMANPNQGMWYAFQLLDPEDDAHTIELTQFKKQFKAHLSDLIRNVSVKIKKHTDEATWIRIAWGDGFSRPDHLKPTYVVHYLQSPYVFTTSLTNKLKPLLSQALALSTKHQRVKDASLSGRNLTGIRDLLMKQYRQAFPSKYPTPLGERNSTVSHPQIEREQLESAAKRHQLACEAFGDGALPQLQSAVYKLETKFRDHTNKTMTERDEPFRCVVKFSSTNLLESLRHCASSGIVSTPVTPLLSSVPLKGRNYFVITDNGTGPSSQTRQPPH